MGLSGVLCLILRVYGWILLGRVIISFIPLFAPSWRPPDGLRPVIDLIYGMTEPLLAALRRVVPQPAGMPLDLSFIILYVIYNIIRSIICHGAVI